MATTLKFVYSDNDKALVNVDMLVEIRFQEEDGSCVCMMADGSQRTFDREVTDKIKAQIGSPPLP